MTRLQSFSVITVTYLLAHGLTALLITPLQARLLPEITAFASLLYLPHGVRVLSSWLLGPAAFLPLCLGAFLSEAIFTPAEISSATDPVILASIAVGAGSAPLAFELFRRCGRCLYAGRAAQVNWKWLLLVGMLASLINSIGQGLVFSHAILPEDSPAVLATYAAGDLIGLVATTLALMLVFRWIRLRQAHG